MDIAFSYSSILSLNPKEVYRKELIEKSEKLLDDELAKIEGKDKTAQQILLHAQNVRFFMKIYAYPVLDRIKAVFSDEPEVIEYLNNSIEIIVDLTKRLEMICDTLYPDLGEKAKETQKSFKYYL